MDTCTIAEAAARTGFSASSLRYYEQVGLITPERTPAGYRQYDERDLARLEVVRRAKALGLNLDEIGELVDLWAGDRCEPVQDRLRELVDDKVRACERQARDADALARQLRAVAAGLGSHTPDGPCDDECGCAAEPESTAEPLVCTLPVTQWPSRLHDWKAMVAEAVERETTPSGARLVFPRAVDAGRLATLAAAEQGCCAFLAFDLAVRADAVVLEVSGDADARPVIDALVAL